jgi:hypothetical protein
MTMTETNDFQTSDLEQTILINEEIKRIVSSSAEMRLSAINAMLTARRSGKASLGFAVVSTELRTFSRQLDGYMRALSELIARLIYSVARMLNESRIERILKATLDQSDKACEMLGKTVDQKVAQICRIREGIARDWQLLSVELGRAERLCTMGVALSRSAKIEAAHGGDMASTLGQVAIQIEETVGCMRDILMTLKTQVAR